MTYRSDAGAGAPVIPPSSSTVDLHTHTTRSDGVQDPASLVEAAAAAGVRTLAITDHDTLVGLPAAREAAARTGITLIAGLEINTIADDADGFREGELHILGYGVDPDNEALEAALGAQRERRRLRFWRIVARLQELGLPVEETLRTMPLEDADDALGRPTVARALVALNHAASVDDAFRRYLARGQPAYVPRDGLGPKGAIDAIRAAGGIAVLAHFAEAAERPSVVRDLMALGLRGLEVYYRSFAADTVRDLEAVAKDLGLVATGGSDYHGDHETYAEAHAALWVPPGVATAVTAAISSATKDRAPNP